MQMTKEQKIDIQKMMAERSAINDQKLKEMLDAGRSIIRIGFTGHRPNKLGGYDLSAPGYANVQQDLEIYIEKNLAVYDIVVGHSGLALGGDTIWSKAIIAMKEKFPGRVFFHAEVPMLEQADAWFKQTDIDLWRAQIDRADFATVYGSLEGLTDAERKKMSGVYLNTRNVGMIEHSDVMLALHDGSAGGTGNAVRDSKKRNVPVLTVHPNVYFG